MDFVPNETVNKLILLFMLEKMEIPLTENSIIDITTNKNEWLKYIDCIQLLYELVDIGFITTSEKNSNEQKFHITYEGRSCLSYFFKRIPLSLREEITNFTKQNRLHFKRKQEYVGNYDKFADGSYLVTLTIKEPMLATPMFEIKVKTPSRNSAINAVQKWQEKAPNTYEYIYDTFLNDEGES